MTSRDAVRAPSHDPVVVSASEVIGGPVGRWARPRRVPQGAGSPRSGMLVPPWQPIAAILAFAATLLLAAGVVQKGYCLRNGWAAPDVFWKSCYSDLPSLTGDAIAGQPVGTGVLLALIEAVVPTTDTFSSQQAMYLGWAVVAAVLLVALVVVTVLTRPREPWSAAHIALSPLIVLVVLVAPDLWGVTLTSVALWLWSRDRPLAAGLVMGVAIAARTYPVLIVVVLGLLAVRAGVPRRWAPFAGAAVISGTVVSLGGALSPRIDLTGSYQTWAASQAGLGSPWFLATLGERPLPLGSLTALTILGWVLALAVGVALTFAARHRPTVAEVSLVVVAIVLVTGKALPVQASLWLLPLVALAGLRWRDHLVWASTEVAYFVIVWLYLGGRDLTPPSVPPAWFAVFLILRLAGILWLAWAAGRAALTRPAVVEPEPWRARAHLGTEDPDDLSGPMTGRPDAVVVSYR